MKKITIKTGGSKKFPTLRLTLAKPSKVMNPRFINASRVAKAASKKKYG